MDDLTRTTNTSKFSMQMPTHNTGFRPIQPLVCAQKRLIQRCSCKQALDQNADCAEALIRKRSPCCTSLPGFQQSAHYHCERGEVRRLCEACDRRLTLQACQVQSYRTDLQRLTRRSNVPCCSNLHTLICCFNSIGYQQVRNVVLQLQYLMQDRRIELKALSLF